MWNGVGAVCGSPEQVRAAKQTIRRALKGKVNRLVFLSESRLGILRRYPNLLSRVLRINVPDLLHSLSSSYGMMRGVPSRVALPLAYWRNRRQMPPEDRLDPARDGCGLLWFAPIIPMTRADVAAFRQVIEPIMSRYGFECCITLTAVNERCFDCTLPLLFDRENASEAELAMQCYEELSSRCAEAGYLPYRLGLQSMERELSRDDAFWSLVTTIKRALDPSGIVSPGRYTR